jgi:uncharacterized protein YqjF (DUF2071 family)
MLKPVLTANWRYLAFFNFEVDPRLLAARVPPGTELDLLSGVSFLSVVSFLSGDTVLIDQPPLRQRLFECVQLRFHVRQRNLDDWRRGVVIVREIVPRVVAPVLTHVFPGHPLLALGMRHYLIDQDGEVTCEYAWRDAGKWESLSLQARGDPRPVPAGSAEDFYLARPWRFTALASRVIDYRLEHPRWLIRPAATWKLGASVFGSEFTETLQRPPSSVFIADGSHVRLSVRS